MGKRYDGMISFTILMCFSRMRHTGLLKENIDYALREFTGKYRLVPVCDTIEQVLCWSGVTYAEPLLVAKRPGWFMGHHMLNVALDQLLPVSEPNNHYFGTWTDDDAYEPRFFQDLAERIEKAGNPQVAVVSMRRWMHRSTPVDHLAATHAHMRVCSVGLEQIYVRSDIAQHYRYGNSPIADGFMVEQLYRECGKGFAFFNELVVNWNRWM